MLAPFEVQATMILNLRDMKPRRRVRLTGKDIVFQPAPTPRPRPSPIMFDSLMTLSYARGGIQDLSVNLPRYHNANSNAHCAEISISTSPPSIVMAAPSTKDTLNMTGTWNFVSFPYDRRDRFVWIDKI